MLFLRPYVPVILFYYLTINLPHAQTYEISDPKADDTEIEPSETADNSDIEYKDYGSPELLKRINFTKTEFTLIPSKLTITPTLPVIFTTTVYECPGSGGDETTTEGSQGSGGGGGGGSGDDTTTTTESGSGPGGPGGNGGTTEGPDGSGKSLWSFDDQVFPPDTGAFDTQLCGNDSRSDLNGVLIVPQSICAFKKCKPSTQKAVSPVQTIGQGIIWDTTKLKILFVDKFGQQIVAYNPSTGWVSNTLVLGVTLNTVIPTTKLNQYVVVVENKIVAIETIFMPSGLVARFHHICVTFDPDWSLGVAKTDLEGRVWIAARFKTDCEDQKIKNYIYMINKGEATVKETDIGVTGGMAWCSKFFYVVDIDKQCIYKYKSDKKTGNISSRKVLFDVKKQSNLAGVPNDIVVDNKNQLWCTIFLAGKVVQIDSTSGKILQTVKLTSYYPVSLAFGGIFQNKLFVTTAYGNDPELQTANTLVIDNLGVTGISATKPVNAKTVFSVDTIKVDLPKATDCSSGFVTSKYFNTKLRFNCDKCNSGSKNMSKISCGDYSKKCFVQRLHVNVDTYGNSLHYDSDSQALYMTDVYGPSFIKDFTMGIEYSSEIKLKNVSVAAAIIPIKGKWNKFIAAEDTSIVIFENTFIAPIGVSQPYKKILHTLDNNNCSLMFSRGKIDCEGRLWIGVKSSTVIPTNKGKLYVFTKKEKVELNLDEVKEPGGMAWSKDDKLFYLADWATKTVYSYKFNSATGAISSPKTFYKTDSPEFHVIDLTVDNEDFIWATVYGQGAVVRIDPKSGAVKSTIPIPSKYPVSLEFGGRKRDILYVSTSHGLDCTSNSTADIYAIYNLGVRAAQKKTRRFVY